MTVDVRDILLKAAEDVQSGMWCKGAFFENHKSYTDRALIVGLLPLDKAMASKRCARGSLAVATKLLGGTVEEYDAVESVATDAALRRGARSLVEFNDGFPDDPFEAGQQLAAFFRQAADA